jgi:RNA polymerase sigma factor (sigma-70 family)
MHEQADDIAVIKLVLQGNQAAYASLVTKYRQYVFTLVMRYVTNREAAEEISQDVFVKAYRNLADFRGNSKFSTWLYTIVNTTCLSHLRNKKHNTILLSHDKMVTLTDQTGPGEQPAQTLEKKTQKQWIDNAIKHLPETDAQIITLFYQADQTVEEIGQITGLTTSNVKVRLFRARQKLKEILTPALKEEI